MSTKPINKASTVKAVDGLEKNLRTIKKPIKPRPGTNIFDFPAEAITDWWKPRPSEPEPEEEI